jgi:hypothetical protein
MKICGNISLFQKKSESMKVLYGLEVYSNALILMLIAAERSKSMLASLRFTCYAYGTSRKLTPDSRLQRLPTTCGNLNSSKKSKNFLYSNIFNSGC